MFTFMLGVTRVWFSMSRDGLLPAWFAKTHRHGTPQPVTWIAGVASAVIAGFLPDPGGGRPDQHRHPGRLRGGLRRRDRAPLQQPDAPRTFRLPLMPVVPAFGVLASLFLMFQLHWETWLRFVVWLIIGLIIYFVYSRKHSLMNPDSPRHRAVS